MSQLFKLNWKDLLKGLVVSVFMAVLTFIYNVLLEGNTFEIKEILIIALGAGIAYLSKNLLTNDSGDLLKK